MACFAAGVWILVDDRYAYINDVIVVTADVNVNSAAYVMMSVGIVVFFSSIVGCCAMKSNNTGLLFCVRSKSV